VGHRGRVGAVEQSEIFESSGMCWINPFHPSRTVVSVFTDVISYFRVVVHCVGLQCGRWVPYSAWTKRPKWEFLYHIV